MFGASYMGYTQWLAAVARPPHLEVMAPECCAADYWVASFDPGGTFRLAQRLGWTASLIAAMAQEWGIDDPALDKLRQAFLDARRRRAGRRPRRHPSHPRGDQGCSSTTCTEPGRSRTTSSGTAGPPGWTRSSSMRTAATPTGVRSIPRPTTAPSTCPPSTSAAGTTCTWHGVLHNFTGMRRQAPTERARQSQRLVVGPWAHWTPMVPVVGRPRLRARRPFSTRRSMRLDWFRPLAAGRHRARTGHRSASSSWATNKWRDEQEWPLARTRYTPWYLGQGGRLGPEPPGGDESPDSVHVRSPEPGADLRWPAARQRGGGRSRRAGPASPAPRRAVVPICAPDGSPGADRPAVGGAVGGHRRPRHRLHGRASGRAPRRAGVEPLRGCRPGPPQRHTHAVGRRRRLLLHHRPDCDQRCPAAGHRLRLHVSSSSFPEWEPNPNTGRPVGVDTDADLRPAHQQVFHDARHPSRLVLPVIPPQGEARRSVFQEDPRKGRPASTLGSRGRPRTRSPTMLRWIWSEPP